MKTNIIVLAAGKGTRMKSVRPKVLHPIADKPLLGHVLDTVGTLDPRQISVVIGHGSELVQAEISHDVNWVMQTEQLGTGHAVQMALPHVDDSDRVIIAYGDVPLTRKETFGELLDAVKPNQLGLLTVIMDDATGYGRIMRNADNQVTGIVEQKDATPEQQAIREMNSGMLSIQGALLKSLLDQIDNNNAQNEYYLTDIFALAVGEGCTIKTVHPRDEWEVAGVNSRVQLAELERIHQLNMANELMDNGVSLRDPSRLDIRGQLQTGSDIELDVNIVFVGENVLADNVSIGANCTIINSTLGEGTIVHPNSIVENAELGANCSVGPFARLRPGSKLSDKARIGNFVEIKNADIGYGSKVNHLSYVGDAELGSNVNVGAGTITCNYDGANKHRTVMGDDVFIGSNSALVAPITIGPGATVGAGATLSKDVEDNALVVTRSKRTVIHDYQRPVKKPK